MFAKRIIYGEEARNKIKAGVDKLANAVTVTLGPRGRNVIIESLNGKHIITKDGVTTSKSIKLDDPQEDLGAQLVKEAASRTSDDAGDGTTTSTLLTQAIYSEGLRYINAGSNPIELKRGIDLACEVVVNALRSMKTELANKDQITQVATISANGDEEIGNLISNALEKIGKDGAIMVDSTYQDRDTQMEIVEGYQFDKGYVTPFLVTDKDKMEAEYTEVNGKPVLVLLYDKRITAQKDIVPILEYAANGQAALLIICEDMGGEALATIIANKLRGVLKCVVVKCPSYGERRKEIMEDLAIATGGVFISEEAGMSLSKFDKNQNWLGKVKKVMVTNNSTTLFMTDDMTVKQAVAARVDEIRARLTNIDRKTDNYSFEKTQQRLAKLTCGIALLKIGASTETEISEKKDRVDDAIHATQAALEEGIVPGGGTAFIACLSALDNIQTKTTDQAEGVKIVRHAITLPLRKIADNSGKSGEVVLNKVLENISSNANYGYNAATDTYGDMFEFGILNPCKVDRVALQNAASAAGMLLTSECAITNIVEKNAEDADALLQAAMD